MYTPTNIPPTSHASSTVEANASEARVATVATESRARIDAIRVGRARRIQACMSADATSSAIAKRTAPPAAFLESSSSSPIPGMFPRAMPSP